MNTPVFDSQAAAQTLFQARQQLAPCAPVAERFGITSLEQAYATQRALTALQCSAGLELIGYKLGLTDPRAQQAMGLNHPLFGVVAYDWQCCEDEPVPTPRLMAPRVEAEVAFVFAETLDGPDLQVADLLDALGGVAPALEICDSALTGWPRNLFDALADNLSSGLFVLGSRPLAPRDVDLSTLEVQLQRNDLTPLSGHASQCMGNPLNACLWLARELARQGTPIRAGEIVLSGALAPMQEVGAGDRVRVEMGELGVLECRFA